MLGQHMRLRPHKVKLSHVVYLRHTDIMCCAMLCCAVFCIALQRVFYFWGLQQEEQGVILPNGKLLPPRWFIRDMMWQVRWADDIMGAAGFARGGGGGMLYISSQVELVNRGVVVIVAMSLLLQAASQQCRQGRQAHVAIVLLEQRHPFMQCTCTVGSAVC
jgi:hypothetical protein